MEGEKRKHLPANPMILENAPWYFTLRFICKLTGVKVDTSITNSPNRLPEFTVVCNKFAITDKPLHKHDSNKYESKAFFICNQRSFQTRFVTCVNKTYWVWVMYWSLLINSTSTAPIRSCVRGRTQFLKMVGFLRQTFPSLPPPPIISLFCSCPNFLDELVQNACYAGCNYRRL